MTGDDRPGPLTIAGSARSSAGSFTAAAGRAAAHERAHASLAEAAALQLRAAAAVAAATVSAVAARHGRRLALATTPDDAAPSLEPRPKPVSRVFAAGGVPGVRHLVENLARACGLVEDARSGFVLAVQELLTNAVRHGGGWGTMRLHRDEDQLVCVVSDHGPGFPVDPARLTAPPAPGAEGGRGLWLARRTADSLLIRTSPTGVTATVTMRLLVQP